MTYQVKTYLAEQAIAGHPVTVKTDFFLVYAGTVVGVWGEVTSGGVPALEILLETSTTNEDGQFVSPDGVGVLKTVGATGKFAFNLPQVHLAFQRLVVRSTAGNPADTKITLRVQLSNKNHP